MLSRPVTELFEQTMVGKKNSVTGRESIEGALLQAALAESSVEVQCAELLFEHDMTRMRELAEQGVEIGANELYEFGRNGAYSCQLLVRAGRRLLELSGSSVIYNTNAMGRLVGDLFAGTRHAILAWDFSSEQYGRTRWGIPPLSFRGANS